MNVTRRFKITQQLHYGSVCAECDTVLRIGHAYILTTQMLVLPATHDRTSYSLSKYDMVYDNRKVR